MSTVLQAMNTELAKSRVELRYYFATLARIGSRFTIQSEVAKLCKVNSD